MAVHQGDPRGLRGQEILHRQGHGRHRAAELQFPRPFRAPGMNGPHPMAQPVQHQAECGQDRDRGQEEDNSVTPGGPQVTGASHEQDERAAGHDPAPGDYPWWAVQIGLPDGGRGQGVGQDPLPGPVEGQERGRELQEVTARHKAHAQPEDAANQGRHGQGTKKYELDTVTAQNGPAPGIIPESRGHGDREVQVGAGQPGQEPEKHGV